MPLNCKRSLEIGLLHVGNVDHGNIKLVETKLGVHVFWQGECEPRYDKWFLHTLECMDQFYAIMMPTRKVPRSPGWRYLGTIASGAYRWWDYSATTLADSTLEWYDTAHQRKLVNDKKFLRMRG